MGITYKDAGVDIDAGNEAVKRIKEYVKSTFTKNVLTDVGTFGAMFSFDKDKFKQPVLVSSSDGVGTKLKLAYLTNNHETVGQDLVNHCVNDILTTGANPLFFLDYIATWKMIPEIVEGIVKGFAKACKKNNCALIGGETAEMPGLYKKSEYDLAGFIVGVVEKDKLIDGKEIKQGDKIIGLASNGLHTNGYSLVYKVLEKAGLKIKDYADELMKIHVSYFNPVQQVMAKFKIKGMAHITGGGFDNILRIIPGNLDVRINRKAWDIPEIFRFLQEKGDIDEKEMFRTFNMGIGYVLVVDAKDVSSVLKELDNAYEIGEIVKGSGKVKI